MARNKSNFSEKQIERNVALGALRRIHGFAHKEKLYTVWKSMHFRCKNPTDKRFNNYGGRGIKVCVEWNDYLPFRIWSLANGYTDGLSIDRINNDGNYEPSNCRWATLLEQAKNKSCSITIEESIRTCEICGKIFNVKQRSAKGIVCSRKCNGARNGLRMRGQNEI